MKSYKKLILFLLLFLFIICLKTTVLGVTLTEIEYQGVIFKPDVEPLTLQTTTNSYIIGINKANNRISVIEPYNSNDYLVVKTTNSIYCGTYNGIRAYNVTNNILSDVRIYSTEYNNGSWSSWSSIVASNQNEFGPREYC